jgi:hypothetical protein
MDYSWLMRLGTTDLIAAVVDVGMGVVAAGWTVVLAVRAAHRRRPNRSSK